MSKQARKPIKWVSSAKRDLDAMPDYVKDVFGHAIDLAQASGKHQDAKVMTGFGRPACWRWSRTPRATLTGRLHRQVRRLGLCLALLPEEVQKRHRYAEAGPGFDQHPPEGREAGFRSLAGTARSTQMSEPASIITEEGSLSCLALIVAALIGLLELNAIKGKTGPLTTIKGVITCGFLLTAALYVVFECCTK